jgi:hypothetical protein
MYGRAKEFDGLPFPAEVFEEAISTFEMGIADRGGKIARYECSYWRERYEETSITNPAPHFRAECFSSRKFVFSGYSAGSVGRLSFHREQSSLLVKLSDLPDLALADRVIHVFGKSYRFSRSWRELFGAARADLRRGFAAGS